MIRFLFYLQILPWVVLLSLSDSFVIEHLLAWMILAFGASVLSYTVLSLSSTEEKLEWSGWNWWCKILKIDSAL